MGSDLVWENSPPLELNIPSMEDPESEPAFFQVLPGRSKEGSCTQCPFLPYPPIRGMCSLPC